jgi:hypothetical protein
MVLWFYALTFEGKSIDVHAFCREPVGRACIPLPTNTRRVVEIRASEPSRTDRLAGILGAAGNAGHGVLRGR